MTEQKQDVPEQVAEEPKAPPTPAISAESAKESSAEAGFNAEAFEERFKSLEEMVGKLPDLVDARFKSTTDKSFQDVKKVARYLEQFGGDVDKAVREMAIDEMIEGRGKADPGRSSRTSAQAPSEFDKRTAEILEEAGIPLDDPEVIKLAETPVASEADWYRKLTRLGIQRAKQSTPSASAIVASSGSAAVSGNVDDVAEELQAIQRGERGNPYSNENIERRKALKAKLEELDPMIDIENPDLRIDWTALREGY